MEATSRAKVPLVQQPQADGETIAIVLADDHKVVRSGLRMLLQAEDDLTVVAEAGDATPPSATSAAIVYVLKQSAGDELVGAVRLAARGETYLNPRLGAQVAAQLPTPAGPPDDLTEREVEILHLIALGHTNAEIAEQLYLSVRTVESHRAHIQQKTGRSTRAELVRYALDHDLVE